MSVYSYLHLSLRCGLAQAAKNTSRLGGVRPVPFLTDKHFCLAWIKPSHAKEAQI